MPGMFFSRTFGACQWHVVSGWSLWLWWHLFYQNILSGGDLALSVINGLRFSVSVWLIYLK